MARKRTRKRRAAARRAKAPATRPAGGRSRTRKPARPTKPAKPAKPSKKGYLKWSRGRTPASPRVRVVARKPFIETRTVTQWRKKGKIAKRGTRGAKKVEIEQQVNQKGRVIRSLSVFSATKVLKTMWVPEDGLSTFMPSGNLSGSLMVPMFESNITTSYAGAKLIEVMIRGLDARGKVRRIKLSIEPTKSRRMHELVISRIIKAMREAEVRTSYTIEILRAAKAAGSLKYPLSYDKFRRLEPLTRVEIVITVYK